MVYRVMLAMVIVATCSTLLQAAMIAALPMVARLLGDCAAERLALASDFCANFTIVWWSACVIALAVLVWTE